MKETIEWHYTVEEVLPFNGADVLMKLDKSSSGPGDMIGVFAGHFCAESGFVLPCGECVVPTMWCYFPKGQQ